jgi:hypothetical protein
MAWASRKEGDRVGVGPVIEQVVESNDPHGGLGPLASMWCQGPVLGCGPAVEKHCPICVVI